MGRWMWLARFPLEILVKAKTAPFPPPKLQGLVPSLYKIYNEIKRLTPLPKGVQGVVWGV